MNIYLIITLCIFTVGIFLFLKDTRNFFAGVLLTFGVLGIIFFILMYLSSKYELINILSLCFVYGFIPLCIVIIGFFLIKNGQIMRQKEGRRLANLLSLILGFNILIIVFLTFLLFYISPNTNICLYAFLIICVFLSAYFGFLFFSYLVYSYAYQMLPINKNLNYIIILGSGLIGDKVPPLLKSRLDKGSEIYKKQLEKGNLVKIIVSGGQGPDELVSEASAMKKYLISQNIPNSDILVEDKSTTTFENMLFSKKIMDVRNKKYACIFVTNNYHVFRASIFARKAKLKANGIGSPTAFYFLPSALIREYIAILVLYKWFNILVIVLFSIFVMITLIH